MRTNLIVVLGKTLLMLLAGCAGAAPVVHPADAPAEEAVTRQAPLARPTGFWCTHGNGAFSVCRHTRHECEQVKTKLTGDTFTDCERAETAFCYRVDVVGIGDGYDACALTESWCWQDMRIIAKGEDVRIRIASDCEERH